MSHAIVIAGGVPTAEQAAAVVAAVEALVQEETVTDALPWAYRSSWRRAAIEEGVGDGDVS